MEKLLVDAKEAAEILTMGETKLWSMTNRQLIPHLKIGKSVRYSPVSLQKWIEQQEIPIRAGALE